MSKRAPAKLGRALVSFYVAYVNAISIELSPKAVAIILVGVVVLFVGAISLNAYIRQHEVVSWSGTVASTASSTGIVVSPTTEVMVATSTVPADLLEELNRYWLERINRLRRERNLSVLSTDQRLVATAGEWAMEMERRGEITHVRTDGKTMHQWIDTKQLDFTKRGSENGWKSNYFVENIARFYAKSSVVGMEQALDRILNDFLAEGPGGDHYESIYHPDWNSVGLGYAIHTENATERVYFVFHYGSLNPVQQ